MIKQTVLPFKVETTNDTVTAHGGLALLGEFAIGVGMLEVVDRELPDPGSGAGYRPSEYSFPLVLMLHGGGRSLEDLRQIREDEGLREVLPLRRVPSADAMGDWLRGVGGNGGLEGMEEVEQGLLKRGMQGDGIKGYTIDLDAGIVGGERIGEDDV